MIKISKKGVFNKPEKTKKLSSFQKTYLKQTQKSFPPRKTQKASSSIATSPSFLSSTASLFIEALAIAKHTKPAPES